MNQPETRPSLIARLQGQPNEPAWTQFATAYEPFLRRLVERQGVPPRNVADVTQQVLLAIARGVESWRDDGDPASFRRWIGRVARNVVIKFMSRERRQIAGQGGTDFLEVLQAEPAGNEQQLLEYDYELVLWAAEQVRGEFRETSWRAFWATLIDERPVAHVAEELGVSIGSIYMSRGRIMARIKAKVREVMEE